MFSKLLYHKHIVSALAELPDMNWNIAESILKKYTITDLSRKSMNELMEMVGYSAAISIAEFLHTKGNDTYVPYDPEKDGDINAD